MNGRRGDFSRDKILNKSGSYFNFVEWNIDGGIFGEYRANQATYQLNTGSYMKTKTKKKRSKLHIPATLEEAAQFVELLAKRQSLIVTLEELHSRAMLNLQKEAAERVGPIEEQIKLLLDGLFVFAETHRGELTRGGRRKTARLPTGELLWRMTPPLVRVRNAKAVLKLLEQKGLRSLIRVKKSVDKTAILKNPKRVAFIPGVTIEQHEEFVVKPARFALQLSVDTRKLKRLIGAGRDL